MDRKHIKIFVTVGGQTPFDRLIESVDAAFESPEAREGYEFNFQIGGGRVEPRFGQCFRFMDERMYSSYFQSSDIIVSHCGMGTIIKALELNKRCVILPKLAALGEHRNDHQLEGARRVSTFPSIVVVGSADNLSREIKRAVFTSDESTSTRDARDLNPIEGVAELIDNLLRNKRQ